ncbi:MAG TPA: response regulator [Candidatus Angelobacter sp.]|nr:response regulator [Candidatus Angelobacter sp.]
MNPDETVPKSKIILIAEDDPDDRLLARDALEESGQGAELRFVENGEDLLDFLLQRGKYDANTPRPGLVLLDLNMPLKDGREALREIKSNASLRRIPMVVLTTSRADTDVDLIYELGANSFITKPVRYEALVELMRVIAQYWLNIVELPAGLANTIRD